MTARRGSRGGSGGGEDHRGDAPDTGDAARADEGEAGDADESGLRAMRSVWLAMRDEEPPQRGMAELLAAARQKAVAMQPRPTPWQRLAAALRRPPVLALATAVVLIGGAVVIGRRVGGPPGASSVELDGARPSPSATSSPPGRARVPSATASGAAPQPPAPSGAGPGPGSTADVPSSPPVEPLPSPAALAEPSRLAAPTEHHERPQDRRPVPAKVARDTGAGHSAELAPLPSASTDAKADAIVAGTLDTRLKTGDNALVHQKVAPKRAVRDGVGAFKPADDAPPPEADSAAASAGGDTVDTAAKGARPPRPQRPTLAQLYVQCEAAASRGDCAAVRRLADQIARIDRGYRARVAKDSAVAKCLAE